MQSSRQLCTTDIKFRDFIGEISLARLIAPFATRCDTIDLPSRCGYFVYVILGKVTWCCVGNFLQDGSNFLRGILVRFSILKLFFMFVLYSFIFEYLILSPWVYIKA